MFTSKIYDSWKDIQKRKYEEIFNRVDLELLSGKILDIGFGSGFFQEFLKEKGIKSDMIRIDVDRKAKHGRGTLLADGNKLPFKSEKFDSVISIDSMHFIKTNDFKRVLKKKGFALLSLFFNDQNHEDVRNSLMEKLNGFKIIKEFDIFEKENEYVVVARKL